MTIKQTLKSAVSHLPAHWQSELKRIHFGREIRKGRFRTDELEYAILSEWVSPGDWVLDIGANIGHYTSRLSELVGASGRVIAFEPIPETFELLAANIAKFQLRNVTLVNMAASDGANIVQMSIPKFVTGLNNYYMAHITDDDSGLQIMTLPIDNLAIGHPVSFAKIDAEGHELQVIKGMHTLIKRDFPVLVVEDNSPMLQEYLGQLGYDSRTMNSSSNRIFERKMACQS